MYSLTANINYNFLHTNRLVGTKLCMFMLIDYISTDPTQILTSTEAFCWLTLGVAIPFGCFLIGSSFIGMSREKKLPGLITIAWLTFSSVIEGIALSTLTYMVLPKLTLPAGLCVLLCLPIFSRMTDLFANDFKRNLLNIAVRAAMLVCMIPLAVILTASPWWVSSDVLEDEARLPYVCASIKVSILLFVVVGCSFAAWGAEY
eukprot:Awhi_evm1s3935